VHADTHCDTPRPPHSVANVRDDRDTPPHVERNGRTINLIWGRREAIYVFQKYLTRVCEDPGDDLPDGRKDRLLSRFAIRLAFRALHKS
jgi:hypothetical protein